MIQQKIRSLQVPVKNPIVMQVVNSSEKLDHKRLDFPDREVALHRLHQRFHIVFEIFHRDVDFVFCSTDANLQNVYHVLMFC